MKASDFVACYLECRGVTCVFELVGGMITHLLDSISTHTDLAIVCCHHEQAAGFAAEGYARIKGLPGIALATSGPGATNLLTAIASSYFDSIPAVFITGQVNTHELKQDRGIRQLGFQECDIVSMAKPVSKSAVQVLDAAELGHALEEAFALAMEGRQGPCLIDLPMNVQAALLDDEHVDHWLRRAKIPAAPLPGSLPAVADGVQLEVELKNLLTAIDQSSRPLLLLGGGCATVGSRDAARRMADVLGIPIVFSLMAVDLIPDASHQRVGLIGSYGNRWANKALAMADLLIVVGSRLDIRQTGSDLKSFCEGKDIWHIDLDPSEIGVRVQPQHQLCCSIQAMADQLATLPPNAVCHHPVWLDQLRRLRAQFPVVREYACEPSEINPLALLQQLSKLVPESCHYVTDVGQHQMWAAQSLLFRTPDRFLTSGGMGAMGFGLPAAIGAAFASPGVMTLLISGDGSFQLNIQELETLRRNQLLIKIILFNNNCHGMVRQFQEAYFHGKVQSTVTGYSAPDFTAVSLAYAIPARRIQWAEEMADGLGWLFSSCGPALLEVSISSTSNVYPKLAFGRPFGEMEPEASPLAMEGT